MPPRLFRKALTAALISGFVLSSVALAKHTPKERTQPHTNAAMPFMTSEQLVYDGEFSKLLLRGINIAELRFKAYRPPASAAAGAQTSSAAGAQASSSAGAQAQSNGQTATAGAATTSSNPSSQPLLLSTDVISKGWFHKLFGINFHYHVDSQVEPNAFYALRTDKLDEQGKRVRRGEAIFDQQAKKVEYTERDPNNAGPPRVITAALEGPTQDVVSAVYFLRTQPLTPGQTFTIAVSDSGRVFQVPAVVSSEKKPLKSVLGKTAVVRVDVELFGPGRPIEQGKGKMSIWVTSDDRHIPVKARLSTDMGQLDITLRSIERDAAQ
jgi:Protein of unknown function (DUF3108)